MGEPAEETTVNLVLCCLRLRLLGVGLLLALGLLRPASAADYDQGVDVSGTTATICTSRYPAESSSAS